MLADLRSVVARALSGLDMFTDAASAAAGQAAAAAASGPLSPVASGGGGAGGALAVGPLGASVPPAGLLSPAGSVTPTPGGGVVRRSTMAEGMFSGLPVGSRGR